jgi:hypothetical protein
MNKKVTGLLSIILVISLCFSLAACGKDEKTNTTTAAETTATDETTAAETTTVEDETTAPEQTTDEEETTLADDTTAAPANKIPTTIAEIVAYYNTAANKVKTDKPGYSLTTTNYIGDITSSKAWIQSIIPTALKLVPIEPTTTSVSKGTVGDFPIKGQSYGSKLDVTSLKSATCKDKGSVYEITLNFKDEVLTDLPQDPNKTNHGKAINVLGADGVYEQTDKFKSVVNITKFAPTYTGSYIKCTVEKASGNLKTATYYHNTIAQAEAKPFIGKSLDVTVPFAIEEAYVLKY